MGHTNNTIEVNGKRYDAVTGAVIAAHREAPKAASAVHASPLQTSRRSLDGFARVSRDAAARPAAPKPIITSTSKAGHASPRAAATHAVHHKPQRATTLMRTAVKKPSVTSASVIKAQTRTDILARVPAQSIKPKLSYTSIDPSRHQRAVRTLQHPVVSHFNKQPIAPSNAVRPVPAMQPGAHAAIPNSKPLAPAQSIGRSLDFIATKHHAAPVPAAAAHPTTARPATKPNSTIFEDALARATSHEQTFEDVRKPKTRSKRSRALSYIGISVAFLLVVGFLGLKNAPQMSLKVASYRSGMHAKLPTYQPSDYTFQNLEYKPGNVTAVYASETSKQAFNINQRESNWDSQALLNNVTATAKSSYKTYERAGRTVYVLGNNTATWVDSGILYTVEGNAALTASQLLDLASSM